MVFTSCSALSKWSGNFMSSRHFLPFSYTVCGTSVWGIGKSRCIRKISSSACHSLFQCILALDKTLQCKELSANTCWACTMARHQQPVQLHTATSQKTVNKNRRSHQVGSTQAWTWHGRGPVTSGALS